MDRYDFWMRADIQRKNKGAFSFKMGAVLLWRNLRVSREFGGVENSAEWQIRVFLNSKESFKCFLFFYDLQSVALYDFCQLHSSIFQVIYGSNWKAYARNEEM